MRHNQQLAEERARQGARGTKAFIISGAVLLCGAAHGVSFFLMADHVSASCVSSPCNGPLVIGPSTPPLPSNCPGSSGARLARLGSPSTGQKPMNVSTRVCTDIMMHSVRPGIFLTPPTLRTSSSRSPVVLAIHPSHASTTNEGLGML